MELREFVRDGIAKPVSGGALPPVTVDTPVRIEAHGGYVLSLLFLFFSIEKGVTEGNGAWNRPLGIGRGDYPWPLGVSLDGHGGHVPLTGMASHFFEKVRAATATVALHSQSVMSMNGPSRAVTCSMISHSGCPPRAAGLLVVPFARAKTCDNRSMSAIQTKLTDARKTAFLEELELHGVVARAARAASPHSKRGCVQSFYDERERNPDFAGAWDEAVAQAMGAVEHEIHRRAVEGWEEPIYGGRYKETIVGSTRKYSDRLLELRARALLPAYRERKQVELDANVGLREKSKEEQAFSEAITKLTPEERQQLRALLSKGDES